MAQTELGILNDYALYKSTHSLTHSPRPNGWRPAGAGDDCRYRTSTEPLDASNFLVIHRAQATYHYSFWPSAYRWYPHLVRGRIVYDTYRTMEATRSRHGWVHMFITHWSTLTLQLHNFDLFRTCRTSSFYTVAWQLAIFQLTWRIARSLGDSWASCSSTQIECSKTAKSCWKCVDRIERLKKHLQVP